MDINCNFNQDKKEQWSPIIYHNGSVVGFWWFGRWYNSSRDLGFYYYGAYPYGFMDRIKVLFKEQFSTGQVLHLFSGTLRSEDPRIITFDINPEVKPNIVGDAEKVGDYFHPGTFDLILADPPYDDNHEKYGTKKVSKKKVVSKCVDLLKVGGYLCWLDTLIPQWKNADGWKYAGMIGVVQSTNHKARAITMLRRER